MNIHDWEEKPESEHEFGDDALVVPLSALNHMFLPVAGGKAANLGELICAGFAVPGGFCVTTVSYAQVSVGIEPILTELATTQSSDVARQAELALMARTALFQVPVPTSITDAIEEAYRVLGNGEAIPVAVRSSATAEDLPSASFAGQQETYLNIVGIEALLTAVRRCWASLWTDRAVMYRASPGLDPRTVRMAVVVQRMVQASTAGVLFTANPLTGKRREIMIDANPGLGEAVVSGATNPDHFVVNTINGEIIERRLGDKRTIIQAVVDGGTRSVEHPDSSAEVCLSDLQVHALAELGAQVEAHFGAPQDIEWAIDASGQIFLLQARPITTLFPLPADVQFTDEDLRVYLSFGIQQGTYRPFTPMGISTLYLIASGFSTLVGFPPRDPLSGPRFMTEAASRLFFDVTGALRSSFGRSLLVQMMAQAEVHAAAIFRHLLTDPRLSLLKTPRRALVRALLLLMVRSLMPWYLLQAVIAPRAAQAQVLRCIQRVRETGRLAENADAAVRLAAVRRLLFESPRLFLRVSPVMVAGMQTFALAKFLLGDLATVSECQIMLRGSPCNPTTRMNLALWALSEQVRADPATIHLIQDTPAALLAEKYRAGSLPSSLQQGLSHFLQEYGHQAVAELDLGLPRWSEDPDYVLSILASYQAFRDPALAPDAQFRHAAEEAEAMIATLSHRITRKSWLRGLLASFCLRRARALSGFREMPRFVLALLLARARSLLLSIGEELVQTGRLSKAEDIFFLTLPEANAAIAGTDMQAFTNARRITYAQELTRRHVPLVLLSDGTEPVAESRDSAPAQKMLQGVPASPGIVTGNAHVILDPQGARLEHGEILIAPSTDPGWTPYFLMAGGLVMEMGGAMAHGAIVAREYGIPAVIGVQGATERISSGSRITVDGTAGTIVIEPAEEAREILS